MFPFLIGLVGYIVAYLFWKCVEVKWPTVVHILNAWALPSITVLIFVALWMVLV